MDGVVLPERMFAVGHEPRGERVTPYHKPNQIRTILSTLSEEEIEVLRRSTFGKFLATAEKPGFSGRFVRYILSRQLKVGNPYEIWILFGGKPVRFSLREFAIVTGLPCGEIPKKNTKRKLKLKEEPYWPKLFGTLGSISVDEVVSLLDRKTVGDKILRVKYACLALLSSVLLPTSLVPKINPWHAELIADLEEFFAYPWGRVAFDMVISSIKERDAVGLTQQTLAVKGFVHALQLVMVEAVPSLLEVTPVDSISYSESDEDEEVGAKKPRQQINGAVKQFINPAHARTLDERCQVDVVSIIDGLEGLDIDVFKQAWANDVTDKKVDDMVNLLKSGVVFYKSCFVGGITTEEVLRLEREKKEQVARDKELKARKGKVIRDCFALEGDGSTVGDVEMERLICLFGDHIKCVISGLVDKVNNAVQKIVDVESQVKELKNKMVKIEEFDVALNRAEYNIVDVLSKKIDTAVTVYGSVSALKLVDENCGRELVTVTNHERSHDKSRQESLNGNRGTTTASERFNVLCNSKSGDNVEEGEEVISGDKLDFVSGQVPRVVECEKQNRAGKRNRNVPLKLISDFECDKRTMQLASEQVFSCFGIKGNYNYNTKFKALVEVLQSPFNKSLPNGVTVSNTDISELVERSKVMSAKMADALIYYTSSALEKCGTDSSRSAILFLDTKFAASLLRHYAKFVKRKRNAVYKFPDSVVKFFKPAEDSSRHLQRIYFPFCYNKMHWIGVCVDLNNADVLLLDCNVSYSKIEPLAKSLKFVAAMFPYVYNQVLGKELLEEYDNFSVVRWKGLPQCAGNNDSGVTSIFYMWAHSICGKAGCLKLTPNVVAMEVEKLAVSFHEEFVGTI